MVHTEAPFFLFGMGQREKYFYKNRTLYHQDGRVALDLTDSVDMRIEPEDYTVTVTMTDGSKVILVEDEEGFWCERNGQRYCFTASPIKLPTFEGHPYRVHLRILLHEVLYNITPDGRPLPNIFVYDKPWYRDSALIAMVLAATDNLHLIRDFVLGMNECYDRNNAGHCEPDNLGEALYLISTVSDASHPLVPALVAEAKRLWTDEGMPGLIDFNDHPVYSAKWLKYGLSRLGLDHSWVTIPNKADNYSPLFWMDYKDQHVEIPHREYDALYPYLWWAERHFYELEIDDAFLELSYPLTNETKASQADYEKIRVLSENYANAKNASPHTWHSAEMFLWFVDQTEREN
ncbi:MAG: hypothetical protein J6D21_09790 [Clostridia bacterium]|nr:hypothetical protein [Clostridia bacterium]